MSEPARIPSFLNWLSGLLPVLREGAFRQSSLRNITVLSYFFWNDNRIHTEFWKTEAAFLQTFSVCGLLPGVLVVNRRTDEIDAFCSKFGIEVQVEESLDRGGLPAMSLDCIARLHTRFKTEYVLIIQNDGMPMRKGLENFIGQFDYIGAPWPGHIAYWDLFPYPRFGVGNGGFSLRSKNICKTVSRLFSRYARHIPYNRFFAEDAFYCKTMRLFAPSAYRDMRFATVAEAAMFSVECAIPSIEKPPLPLGFHSPIGFENYMKLKDPPTVFQHGADNTDKGLHL